ncbi:MAG: CRTAC1 family protein [Fuerstiella sp.]
MRNVATPDSCRLQSARDAGNRSGSLFSRAKRFNLSFFSGLMAVWAAAGLIAGCSHQDTSSREARKDGPAPAEPATSSETTGTSTGQVSPTRISFTDVTSDSGISFVYRNGQEAGHYAILESLGGGVGVIDADRDGREDLLLPGGGTISADVVPAGLPCGLFRNLGGMKFADISQTAGVARPHHYSHGVAAADFDNDGFTDALVTGYGGLQLFHNQGDGTFRDISSDCGLTDEQWSSSAAWGDITGDGALDLYVAHYVNWSPRNHPYCPGPQESQREVCPPRDFQPLPDTFFVNSGNGTFTDGTAEFGLLDEGKGLGVLIADLNGDRRPDVYVTNDTVPNILYQNEQCRTLDDLSLISGASLSDRGVPDGSMGVQLLDYNRDGEFDLWVANYERESSALYEGQGNMLFRHVSQRAGVTAVGAMYVGWGTLCADVDQDGDEDVLVSNGHVIRFPRAAPLRQTPLLFENLDGRRFRNVAAEAGNYLSTEHMARGSAMADFDHDGDPDVAVMHTGEPVALLQNDGAAGGFLCIELIGIRSPRDAVGTVVELVIGEQKMVRQWVGGGSYASTGSRRLHFGLGTAKRVDRLEVRWPSGTIQQLTNVDANTFLCVVESRNSGILPQE